MTKEEKTILRAAFTSADGEKALEVLRKHSGADRLCYFSQNEREEAYCLGKIDFFRTIENSLYENQPKEKNARQYK